MNKNNSKRNSVIVVVLLLVVAGVLALHKKTEAPIVETSNSTMPPIENADQIQVTGKASINDLIGFSIMPNTKVHGILSYRGTIQGGYFFEANILINILDKNKAVLKASNGVAKSDWMTSGPVDFEGNIDFTGLPAGPAYFEIHNDNASGEPENDKSILIPIVIE